MKIKAIVDQEACLGYGDCVELAPGAFQLEDTAHVIGDAPEQALRDAARACPAEAILLIDRDTGASIEP
jgi:ferredoxin